MEKSLRLKLAGLTLVGLGVIASGSALAASLKIGGSAQSDFVWFDDDLSHPNKVNGYGGVAGTGSNLSFNNQSNLTAASIYLRGTLMDRWVYNLSVNQDLRDGRAVNATGDFANSRRGGPQVLDAWVGWDRWDPWARFTVGRMNVQQGLENTGNRSSYTFISPAAGQRSFATGRADGFNVEGNPSRWMGYQAGVFYNTTNSGATGAAPGTGANIDTTSQVVIANSGNHLGMVSGRAFLQPLVQPGKVLHVGGTYSLVNTKGDVSLNAAPGGYFNSSDAQMLRLSSANGSALDRNGNLKRTDGYTLWGAEGLAVWGPLHAQAEYMHYDLDLANQAKLAGNANRTFKNNAGDAAGSIKANGWYLQASWLLTGESRNYDPVSGTLGKVNPRNSKWGAWELAGRYDRVDFAKTVNTTGLTAAGTPTSFCGDLGSTGGAGCTNGGKMNDWTVGVNWYANRNVKLMANYTGSEAKYAATTAGLGPNKTAAGHGVNNDRKQKVNVFAVKAQVDF